MIMLPKNSTVHLQPMDAGIIKNFKHNYRKKLVVDYMHALEEEEVFVINLMILQEAWANVKEETIKNCFKKIGFIQGLYASYTEEDVSLDSIEGTYKNEINQIMVEEDMIQTEEVIDEDEILALCQDEYIVEDVVLNAEDGLVDDSYSISPTDLFDAIEIVIKSSSCSTRPFEDLTNDTIRNLKSVRDDLRNQIKKKVVQKTLDDFFK